MTKIMVSEPKSEGLLY